MVPMTVVVRAGLLIVRRVRVHPEVEPAGVAHVEVPVVTVELPVEWLPKPMSFPPAVVVVLNQASTLKICGARRAVPVVETNPVEFPGKRYAVPGLPGDGARHAVSHTGAAGARRRRWRGQWRWFRMSR